MKDTSDVLTVSFDSGLKDESALCVTRKYKGKIIMLKMELGEQADILYRLLTEQMAKAEIKAESEDMVPNKEEEDDCTDIYCENCRNNCNCIEYLEEQERMNEEDDE